MEDDNKTPKNDSAGRLIPKAITVDHLRAALAFPFLHAPYKIGDKHYFEGAAMQCLNDYKPEEARQVDWVLLLDPLRTSMIGMPSNLWEAFALSIIMPTVGLTELGRDVLKLKQKLRLKLEGESKKSFNNVDAKEINKELNEQIDSFLAATTTSTETLSSFETMLRAELYLSEFEIPPEKLTQAWGWSRSSMKDLFEVGKMAGAKLAADMMAKNDL